MGYRLDKNSKKRKIKNERWRNKYLLVAVLFTLSIISNSILPKPLLASAMENKKYEVEIASVEDSIKSEEELFELSKKAEKDDNGDINITLEVKVNKDKLPIIENEALEDVESIKEYSQINKITLNEYIAQGFKIVKDSLIVETIEGENTKELNLDELKDNNTLNTDLENQLNISLNNITSEKINFKYKINTNDDIQVGDNISLIKDDSETEKTEFKYYLSQGEEISVKLPKVLVNIKEVIVEDSAEEEPITNNEATIGEENEGISTVEVDYGSYIIYRPEIINGVNYNSESQESLYFPITIRDFKADYMIFEAFDKVANGVTGGVGMVPNKLSNDKNIYINKTTIEKMAKEIHQQLSGKKYSNTYNNVKIEDLIDGKNTSYKWGDSGYTNDLKEIVNLFKDNNNSYKLGSYSEAYTWYNGTNTKNETKTIKIKEDTYNNVKDQIDSVYKYVYYHMHKLFDTTPVLNYTITGKELRLVKDNNSNKYTFDSGLRSDETGGPKGKGFFPIDGLGFIDDKFHDTGIYDKDGKINYHNFHFTVESHSSFWVEKGKELVFEFSGDDDVWVYLDGNLVIDLGGLHSRKEAKFKITTDGEILVGEKELVDDEGNVVKFDQSKWVDFDFYQMERHTRGSNLKITTNIDFKPKLQVEKKAYKKENGNKVEIKDTDKLMVGDTIYYEFKITNNGNIDLNNLVIKDNNLNLTIDKNNLPELSKLEPNGVITISDEDLKYTITNEDGNKGKVTNKVVVTANSDGGNVSGEDTVDVNVVRASLRIKKIIDKDGLQENNENKTFTIMINDEDGTQYNIEAQYNIEDKDDIVYTLNNLKYGVTYTISEIVPMNYKLTDITGNGTTIIYDKENDEENQKKIIGATIVISKSNNNPLVTITNEKVNNSYFTSENKVINIFNKEENKFEEE